MSEYLLINILIISIPLLFSFENKIKFYNKLPLVLISTLIVGCAYVIWDAIATGRGDWAFNSDYLIGYSIYKLPFEEILFFITVSYASLFIYECLRYYLRDKENFNYRIFYFIFSLAIFIIAFIFINQAYTFIVLIFTALSFLLTNTFYHKLLSSRLYWIFVLIMFVPFLVVNYYLTSLPIVTYNEQAIWGFRIFTIPLEDFFYSFSMLTFYLMVYLLVKEKWIAIKG